MISVLGELTSVLRCRRHELNGPTFSTRNRMKAILGKAMCHPSLVSSLVSPMPRSRCTSTRDSQTYNDGETIIKNILLYEPGIFGTNSRWFGILREPLGDIAFALMPTILSGTAACDHETRSGPYYHCCSFPSYSFLSYLVYLKLIILSRSLLRYFRYAMRRQCV